MKDLLIRCSQWGQLCTGRIGLTEKQSETLAQLRAKDKPLTDRQIVLMGELLSKMKPDLSQTAKSLVHSMWIEREYGRRKEISSKYLDKGIECEEDSIDLLSFVTGRLYIKNEERVNNDYITGIPDLLPNSGVVEDIKSSWDIHTFHKAELTNDNYWQIQGYMDLFDVDNGRVNYCLVDTPEHILLDEFRRASWKMNVDEIPDQFKYEIAKNMIYTDKMFGVYHSAYFPEAVCDDWVEIPKEKRLKQFEVKRDAAQIKLGYQRIEMAREYYQTIEL